MRRLVPRALLGLLVAIVILAVLEGVLRLTFGPPSPPRLLRKTWVATGEAFTVAHGMVTPTYLGMDQIPSFPADPPAGAVRVMGFGESTMRGGSGIALSLEFPNLIGAQLRGQGLSVETVNLARPGMDSHSIPVIVHDALAFHPAIALFYLGHNDIGNGTLEARYGDIRGAFEAHAEVLLERLQIYTQLQRLLLRNATPPLREPTLTPAMRLVAESEFKQNLKNMVLVCQAAGVRPILITPASPLDGWFPSGASCAEVVPKDAWKLVRTHWSLSPDRISPSQMEDAFAKDPSCPDAMYLHGIALLRSGQREAGWAALSDARDHEPYSLRASSGIDEAVRAVAADTGARLVDWEAWLRTGDAEKPYFTDNVHLTSEGHAALARLARPVVEEEVRAVMGR